MSINSRESFSPCQTYPTLSGRSRNDVLFSGNDDFDRKRRLCPKTVTAGELRFSRKRRFFLDTDFAGKRRCFLGLFGWNSVFFIMALRVWKTAGCRRTRCMFCRPGEGRGYVASGQGDVATWEPDGLTWLALSNGVRA